jgi:hypothetical protein
MTQIHSETPNVVVSVAFLDAPQHDKDSIAVRAPFMFTAAKVDFFRHVATRHH